MVTVTTFMILCQCGCGEPAPLAKYTITKKGVRVGDVLPYARGHHMRQCQTNHDVFERLDALSYYLLGVWCSDGCVWELIPSKYKHLKYLYVELSSTERRWIEEIRDMIFPDTEIKLQRDRGTGRQKLWRIRKCDERLAKWLIAHNCTQRKSLTMSCPDIPQNHLLAFVRGVIDGDGSITMGMRKNRSGKLNVYCAVHITSSSKKFVSKLKLELKKIGFQFTLQKTVTKETILPSGGKIKGGVVAYQLSIQRMDDCLRFLKALYPPNFPRPTLERKYRKAMKIVALLEKHLHELQQWHDDIQHDRLRVHRMRNDGVMPKEIALQTGIHINKVKNYLRDKVA